MTRHDYFAYGANMHTDVLRRRGLPTTGRRRPAVLSGHVLWFAHPGGYATVMPTSDPGMVVCGLIMRLTDAQLARLDGFEDGYRRSVVRVWPWPRTGRAVRAWTYVVRTPVVDRGLPVPCDYLHRIVRTLREVFALVDVTSRVRNSRSVRGIAVDWPARRFRCILGPRRAGGGCRHRIPPRAARPDRSVDPM